MHRISKREIQVSDYLGESVVQRVASVLPGMAQGEVFMAEAEVLRFKVRPHHLSQWTDTAPQCLSPAVCAVRMEPVRISYLVRWLSDVMDVKHQCSAWRAANALQIFGIIA